MSYFHPRIKSSLKATALHLGLSLVVAAFSAALVFGLWYPYPYRELVGGRELFLLVVGVDVVCGPLLTLVVFNPKKSRAELVRDLCLIALIQLAALIYGLHTVAAARPVHMVFEVDRFHIVTANEIRQEDLDKAQKPWNNLPWLGPTVIAARDFESSTEMMASLEQSLKGNELAQRAHWWQEFEKSRSRVINAGKPMDLIRKKHGDGLMSIERAVHETGLPESSLRWLPLTSFRNTAWIALIDSRSGQPLSYLPLDAF